MREGGRKEGMRKRIRERMFLSHIPVSGPANAVRKVGSNGDPFLCGRGAPIRY